jgi:hypothetical protein
MKYPPRKLALDLLVLGGLAYVLFVVVWYGL